MILPVVADTSFARTHRGSSWSNGARCSKPSRPLPAVEVQADDYALAVEEKEGIEDRTETNLVNLRRVIYLTIMNALNYEEAVHKLLKVQLKEGQEVCHGVRS